MLFQDRIAIKLIIPNHLNLIETFESIKGKPPEVIACQWTHSDMHHDRGLWWKLDISTLNGRKWLGYIWTFVHLSVLNTVSSISIEEYSHFGKFINVGWINWIEFPLNVFNHRRFLIISVIVLSFFLFLSYSSEGTVISYT